MLVEAKVVSFPQMLSDPSAVSLWVVWNFEFFTINENIVMVRTVIPARFILQSLRECLAQQRSHL